MSACVLLMIVIHVRCGHNKKKKKEERMGYDHLITSVREVRDGDPQILKEPLWGRQG